MKKIIKLHFRIRVCGAIGIIILLRFSDYHYDDYFIYGVIFLYMIFAAYHRYGNFSTEKEIFISRAILYSDAVMLTILIGFRGGIRSDFYLGYYLILGYVIHFRDKYLIYKLSFLIAAAYSMITVSFSIQGDFEIGRLGIRLALLIGTSIVFQIYVRELMHSESQRDDALHMAFSDPLTKAYNRRMLEFIEGDFHKKEAITHAVLIDIDNFKKINDTFGHDIGDQVLVRLAEILSKASTIDNTSIRYGGEEFLLLLEQKTAQDVYKEIDRLREKFASIKFDWQEKNEPITFTAGIAHREGTETLNQLVRKADTAMYRGKKMGKNQVISYSTG